MYRLLLISFLFFAPFSQAQETQEKFSLTAGYFGQLGYHPGAYLGLQVPLKTWQKERSRATVNKMLYVEPRIGYYSWPGYNSNYYIGSDAGILRRKSTSKFYTCFALSLGYVLRAEVTSTTVNFSGKITAKEREAQHTVLAMAGYGFGTKFNANWSWLIRLDAGYQANFNSVGSLAAFAELGIKYTFIHKHDK